LFLHTITAIVRRFVETVVKDVRDSMLSYFRSPEIRGFNNEPVTWLEYSLAANEFHRDSNKKFRLEGLPKIDYRIRLDYGEIMLAKSH
jgi:hypothetical protein